MNTDDVSARRKTAMPNLQAGVDLNLIDSTPLELQKGALDASLYGRHIHANPDCRIKNVNYQRSVEAAITTAMEITTSNPSDANARALSVETIRLR